MKNALIILAALAPVTAFAHPGHESSGFAAGFFHPWLGWDHLLAMVAVGMLAMAGKRALAWRLPLAFVAAMVAGAGLGVAGIGLPGVEPMILASLVVLGAGLALRVPLQSLAPVICALFGLFHGNAHGLEAPVEGAVATFMAGFVLATAMLHGCGMLVARHQHEAGLRVFGLVVAGAGLLAAI
ncbi:HupE/UreJ family protein [Oceanimonas doudoroffii]|uniref:Protein hupE n=1 Tax=Oceanimonas doudoroffii TaxID=84158 RepID=A0A233RG10_9GAMM|nr:HupE/UreJ family protein [Oceanimonas doudoroffii]OXY82323.1 hypothetical protein B6S08_01970 [Oceanimonas doudoroffii]